LSINSLLARQRIAAKITDAKEHLYTLPKKVMNIMAGEVLSVTIDGSGSVRKAEVSRWKAADDCWYVYVQDIHEPRAVLTRNTNILMSSLIRQLRMLAE
jgi:hypothetical protein